MWNVLAHQSMHRFPKGSPSISHAGSRHTDTCLKLWEFYGVLAPNVMWIKPRFYFPPLLHWPVYYMHPGMAQVGITIVCRYEYVIIAAIYYGLYALRKSTAAAVPLSSFFRVVTHIKCHLCIINVVNWQRTLIWRCCWGHSCPNNGLSPNIAKVISILIPNFESR